MTGSGAFRGAARAAGDGEKYRTYKSGRRRPWVPAHLLRKRHDHLSRRRARRVVQPALAVFGPSTRAARRALQATEDAIDHHGHKLQVK
jgi:hypothetical protein